MSWADGANRFIRLSVTRRADGRLDVAYLKDATTAATITSDTLEEAMVWLEATHGGRPVPARQPDLLDGLV